MEPEISVTKSLLCQIESVTEKKDVDPSLKKELQNYVSAETIPFRLVKLVHDEISQSADKKMYLHELIQGSHLHTPEYKSPPRDPELEARCVKLRTQQANKEYRRMVGVADQTNADNYSFGNDIGGWLSDYGELIQCTKKVKEMNRQLISVFNFIITVGGAFAFAYKAVEYSLGGMGNIFALQLMAGLTFATVVFFADLYFMIKTS